MRKTRPIDARKRERDSNGELSKSTRIAAHLALLVGLSLLCYANTFEVPFQFDDHIFIESNPVVKDLSFFASPALARKFVPDFDTRCLGLLTLAVNHALNGLRVQGYHVFNLSVHCVNAILLYFFVLSLFKTPGLRESALQPRSHAIALIVALLFACHPIQTQAVTYIWQRIAALAVVFYLLAHLSYVQWRLSGRKGSLWYIGALVSSVLAMITKEIAFTLPITIGLCEVIFFREGLRKRFYPLVPFLATMLIIPVDKVLISDFSGISAIDAGARVASGMSRATYLFTEFRVIVTYFRLMVCPVNQNLDYDYPLFTSFLAPEVIGSFLFLCALAGTGVLLLRMRGKLDQAVGLISFGILWVFITLSVESGIIPIDDVIYEHRMYLPSVGFLAASVVSVFVLMTKMRNAHGAGKVAFAGFAVLIAFLSVCTYARNKIWGSDLALWADVVQKSPLKARGYNNLGMAYFKVNNISGAIAMLSRAVELKPAYADAWANRGMINARTGNHKAAMDDCTRAIALNPRFRDAYNDRGLANAELGNYKAALDDFTRAVAIDPRYAEAYCNRGGVYLRMRQPGKAAEDIDRALALKPAYPEAHNSRGVVYSQENAPDKAIMEFDKAIALMPGYAAAHSNRGYAFARMNRPDSAIVDFKTACMLGRQEDCDVYQRISARGMVK
ncbi:MAG TPA: tetratricopeptide repeat protein [Dissulfurispiraceae bacterium]